MNQPTQEKTLKRIWSSTDLINHLDFNTETKKTGSPNHHSLQVKIYHPSSEPSLDGKMPGNQRRPVTSSGEINLQSLDTLLFLICLALKLEQWHVVVEDPQLRDIRCFIPCEKDKSQDHPQREKLTFEKRRKNKKKTPFNKTHSTQPHHTYIKWKITITIYSLLFFPKKLQRNGIHHLL